MINRIKEKAKTVRSFMKGCMTCGGNLPTRKEKLIRTCNICGKKALNAFEKMGTGQFKEGYNEILDIKFNPEQKKVMNKQIKKALSPRKRKLIMKMGKKKGLTEEEIESSLKDFQDEI